MTTGTLLRDDLGRFVDSLAEYTAGGIFNPWSESLVDHKDPDGPARRRERLLAHLDCQATLILVGDHLGYQDGAETGVPYTTPAILRRGVVPRVPGFDLAVSPGYLMSGHASKSIWKALRKNDLTTTTVLWNVMPWHTHTESGVGADRDAGPDEIAIGMNWMQSLLEFYPHAVLAAMGEEVGKTLRAFGIRPVATLPYPSYRGSFGFHFGMRNGVAPMDLNRAVEKEPMARLGA